ncbi:MAG: tetratricopeptide repeat protein [Candidatus Melainabacteria bacterium]|nr:tetratricopeptide repeat protein [Candidatus Melainabacteria bacterium]
MTVYLLDEKMPIAIREVMKWRRCLYASITLFIALACIDMACAQGGPYENDENGMPFIPKKVGPFTFKNPVKIDPFWQSQTNGSLQIKNLKIAILDESYSTDTIKSFNWLFKLFPGDAEFLALRGAMQLDAGNLKNSLEDLDAAIKLERECGTAFLYRSIYENKLGFNQCSKADAQKALPYLPFDPANPLDLYDRAVLLSLAGKTKDKKLHFQRVIDNIPDTEQVHWMVLRAKACLEMGELSQALRYIDKALSIGRDCERLHYLRACVNRIQGKNEDALSDLNKLLAAHPDHMLGQRLKGEILNKK